MARLARVVILMIGLMATQLSAQNFFSDSSHFFQQLQPGYYNEQFADWTIGEPLDGHQSEWESPGENGWSWTVSALGPGNNQLYSLYQAVSPSSHDDDLLFQLTGAPTYAFSGEFWGTQYDGFPQATDLEVETDTGLLFSQQVAGPTFVGIVSDVPLNAVIIRTSGLQPAWPATANVTTGTLLENGDFDGDGMRNADEFAAGTSVTDPHSNLRILNTTVDPQEIVVRYLAVANKVYRLEVRDYLDDESSWLPAGAGDQSPPTSGQSDFSDPRDGHTLRFYRVTLIPPI